MSADGGPARRLTTGPSSSVRPSWSRDGRWIYFGSDRGGDWQIWKESVQGGTPAQVTKSKGSREAFESYDGKFVFFAKLQTSGIFKMPVEGGEETQVLQKGGLNFWAMTDQGICFFDLSNPRCPVLKFHNLASGKTTLLRQFPRETEIDYSGTALSVSPDGRWILYTQFDQAGSDLMLVENFR
jgi:Tol biopolymer transport system component